LPERLASGAPATSASGGDDPRAGSEPLISPVPELPILLVDDREENLQALEAVLSPLRLPLHLANSGAEALRLLLEHDYALILLDVRMPGLDGIETARLIKGRERNRDVPIVFLTAAQNEIADIVLGYDIGAIDYVLKPFDPDLLRSKVAVFAELESSRRALKRSEAFLRGAFEAAPIGKTVLDGKHCVIRANPAFARLLGRPVDELEGVRVETLCEPDDRDALSAALDLAATGELDPGTPEASFDIRLQPSVGDPVWVAAVTSAIEQDDDLGESMLLVQWVDLSARRRAENARAELLLEQAARAQAEAVASRLGRLQQLSAALESLSLDELLPTLARRLLELFGAQAVEIRIDEGVEQPLAVRVPGGEPGANGEAPEIAAEAWVEVPIQIERAVMGRVRLALDGRATLSGADESLLYEAVERASLSIRRAQLHEEEHRVAVELQRGLLPKELPAIPGVEIAAHYESAGIGTQVGGDWYDAFALEGGRIGLVVGDVAGRGIPAASAMGQLRSITRGFALGDDRRRPPGDVLRRLNRHQLALHSDELFTILYAIIDPGEGTITWANAGHPPPLRRSADGRPSYLEAGDGLIGMEDVPYRDITQPLGKGDLVVLYTDGLIERRGEALDVGMERLAAAVESGPDDPTALSQHILERALPGERQLYDDVTEVIVKLS